MAEQLTLTPEQQETIRRANAAGLRAEGLGAGPAKIVDPSNPSPARYEAPTPVVSQQPTPGSIPSPYQAPATDALSGVIERYKSENSPEALAAREATIREETAKQRRAQIDAIEQVYSAKKAREAQLGEQRLASTRSMNLRSGLGGSDFGVAEKDKTRTNTKEVLDTLDEQKSIEISNVMREFDALATQKVEADLNKRRQTAQDQIAMTEKIVGLAKDRIKVLGQAGISVAALKTRDPQLYDTIRTASGMSDLEIDSALNDALPPEKRVQYQTEKIALPNGNAGLLKFGFDPLTNTTTKQTYDMGVKYESLNGVETKEVDGILYKVDRSNGSLTPLTQQSEKAKLELELKQEQIKNEKAQRDNIYSQINERKNKAITTGFKPTSAEKSAVMRFAGKTGAIDKKTQEAIDTDPAFFYALLDKAINDSSINKTPFASVDEIAAAVAEQIRKEE